MSYTGSLDLHIRPPHPCPLLLRRWRRPALPRLEHDPKLSVLEVRAVMVQAVK